MSTHAESRGYPLALDPVPPTSSLTQRPKRPKQLVVIDRQVANYQSLIDQLGPSYSYLLLDAKSDGVRWLAN